MLLFQSLLLYTVASVNIDPPTCDELTTFYRNFDRRRKADSIASMSEKQPTTDWAAIPVETVYRERYGYGNRTVYPTGYDEIDLGDIDTCFTFEERYKDYNTTEMLEHLGRLNECYPDRSTAVSIRLEFDKDYPPETHLNFIGLIVEAGWVGGYAVRFMANTKEHHPTSQFVTDRLKTYPKHLVPLLVLLNEHTLYQTGRYIMGNFVYGLAIFNSYHLESDYLFHVMPKLEYHWIMEIDVRATTTWDIVFRGIEDKAKEGGFSKLPDFVNFYPTVMAGPEWMWRPASWRAFASEDVQQYIGNFYGLSRALFDVSVDWSQQGYGAYFEAYYSGLLRESPWLTSKAYYFPSYQLAGKGYMTYSFLGAHPSTSYYRDWMNSDELCRSGTILHPVKL